MSERYQYDDIYSLLTNIPDLISWVVFEMQEQNSLISDGKLIKPEEFTRDTSEEVSVLALGNVLASGPTLITLKIDDFMQYIPDALQATSFQQTEEGASHYPDLMARLGTRLWAIGALQLLDKNRDNIAYVMPTKAT